MRVLLIHASRFSYHVTDRTSAVSSKTELPPALEKASLGDVLVAFLASEKVDEKGIESVASQAAAAVADQAKQVRTGAVMLYPYAHLSSELSSPRVATKVLDRIRELMEQGGFGLEIHHAPFGFYKGFEIECKGHPLSELARTIVPAEGATAPPARPTRPWRSRRRRP